ncbi:MAG: MBG domain-containing protein, partial [Paracoccaceae bacterium]
ITADALSRIYGDTFAFVGTEFTTSGLLGTDSVDSVTLSSSGEAQFANVGTYATTATNPVGTGLSNYTISIVDGSLSVTPAPLTITADALSRIYGYTFAFAGTEFTTSGLLGTDSVDSVTLSSSGEAQFANVGTYVTTATNPVGSGVSNYAITIVDGSLSVALAPLTITADALTRLFGDDFAYTGTEFSTTGLLGSDSVDSVELSSTGATQFANVGSYVANATNPTGSGLSNYTITVVDGTLTVTPAPLTITASDLFRITGDSFAFTGAEFTASGLQRPADQVTSVTLQSDGAETDAPAASYTITPSNAQGSGLSNYSTSYQDGTLLVLPENAATPPTAILPPPPPVVLPTTETAIVLPGDTTTDTGSTDTGSTETTTTETSTTRSIEQAQDTLTVVSEASSELQENLESCDPGGGDVAVYLSCMSIALDQYADQLADISEDLPEGLSGVADIVRMTKNEISAVAEDSRQRLANATTDAEREAIRQDAVNQATASLQNAQSEIRKAIALVRAEDPELAALQRQQGETILVAIESTETGLSRAVGL